MKLALVTIAVIILFIASRAIAGVVNQFLDYMAGIRNENSKRKRRP